MTQLAIATELHEQAVADFRVSERFAYAFIMKVKQIRDARLYKELGFTNFDEYCETAWKYSRRAMDERIQIADSYGDDFERTCAELGVRKSLMLARMEPEIRQQIEASTDINETTVKQLKELERKAKETEQQLQLAETKAKTAKETAEKFASELRNRPTIEKPVSMPNDLLKINQLERQIEQTKNQLKTTEDMRKIYEKDSKEYKELKDQINFLNKEKNDLSRQIESATALSGLSVKIDYFLKTELSPLRYSRALERLDSEVAVRNLSDILQSVENWLTDMKRYVPQQGRKIVEVIDYDHVS